jgi:hypothetical protein
VVVAFVAFVAFVARANIDEIASRSANVFSNEAELIPGMSKKDQVLQK